MKKTFVRRFTATLGGIFVTASMFSAHAQTGLQVSYGLNGIQTLAYGGTVLENLGANPGDGFHIWHMKSTDLNGNPISSGQYGWGEANNGRSWNPSAHTWTYNFVWGTIQVAFAQVSDALNMTVTTTNYGNSGIIFDGASIYPFVLHFPQLPVNFTNASYNQFADNRTGPSVTVADFGAGEVAAVATDATKPLFSGYQPAGGGNNYTPLMSGTSPDSLAGYLPHYDRPVAPGQTDTYVVALRFAPSGTATAGLAADAYQSWAATYPSTLSWSDRRIIGTVYLASSPSGPANVAGGYPNNPRRYFNDSNAADFDVRTSAGLAKFQAKVLAQAASNVQNLTRLGAQGAITWDIEGEQFPQETSYVCSPDQIATVAPEMESVITNSSSPYAGMKLDDAYFKIMSSAGFRIGVCIRPQQFTLNADGTAGQVYLPDAQVAAQLIRKMKYAHDRWGVTLFYVDSTVQSTGGTLDAGIFQQVAAALPDSLVMPEETTPRHFAYAAPFVSFIFHTALGTDASVYNYYPHAFSVNLVNDVSAATLAQYQTQLTQSVKNGDILMVHADYWQANNPTVVQIYQNAGVTAPTPTPPVPTPPVPTPPVPTPPVPAPPVPTPPVPTPPVPTPPVPTPPVPTPPVPTPPVVTGPVAIVSPAAGSTVSGVITVQGTITLPLDAAGSFLMVDGQAIGTRRVTNGPYVYALDTTTLTNGVHSLQIWAHDIGNNTTISPAVQVTVAN